MHPTGACSRKQQARLLQQSAVRHNRPAAQPTSIGTRASARLVLQRRKFDPISNDIREKLHWLPIQQRIIYKLCLLVFRCLRGEAPAYLCEMLTPLSGVHHLRPLRSAAHGNLHIPRTRTRTFSPRSFSVSGPSSWNKLPDNLKNIELTLQVFKSQLKTHLFHQAYGQ